MVVKSLDDAFEIKFPTDGIITPEDLDHLGRIANLATALEMQDLSPENLRAIANAHLPELTPQLLKTHEAVAPIVMPNLSYLILKLGLDVEKAYNKRLLQDAKDAREIQETIERLINLSAEFAIYADGESEKVLSDELHEICRVLKEEGIEILQSGEKKISKGRMAEIKANIGSHTERLKTDLQIKFTTEIQVKINELHSILDCLKTIEKYLSRLHSTIVSNQKTK